MNAGLCALWVEAFNELEEDELSKSPNHDSNSKPDPAYVSAKSEADAEEYVIVFRQHDHSWVGFLEDFPEMAMGGSVDVPTVVEMAARNVLVQDTPFSDVPYSSTKICW